jgi:hypothetical protein
MSVDKRAASAAVMDEMISKILHSDGLMIVVVPPKGETPMHIDCLDAEVPPPLEMMQEKIGGWVELVTQGYTQYAGKTGQAYVDEEGLLKRLPVNLFATALVQALFGVKLSNPLHGPVVILIGSNVVWK